MLYNWVVELVVDMDSLYLEFHKVVEAPFLLNVDFYMDLMVVHNLHLAYVEAVYDMNLLDGHYYEVALEKELHMMKHEVYDLDLNELMELHRLTEDAFHDVVGDIH